MEKLGIIIDSFAGLTEAQAKEKGYHLLPLQVEIEDQIVKEETIQNPELLKKIQTASDFKTSLPQLGLIDQVLEECSQKYEQSVFIGISSKLSSTAQYISNLGQEKGNITVIENNLVGKQILKAIEIAQKTYEESQSIELVQEKITEFANQCEVLIVPFNLKYMIKGGRLSGMKKLILSAITLYPILRYDNDGSVTSTSIKRTFSGAVSKVVDRISEIKETLKESTIEVIQGIDTKANKILSDLLAKANIVPDFTTLTPTAIAVHTGPEAICLTIMPKKI
ncbi:DegV family protein [Mycoplasmopsis sturni]|uniref:DegV family protein n=1 Tax=Mycoplasmopsis sturni TaxID=39047 RepID=UPI00056CE743|nr:DegV family protein [Mycoplasmopsis sturni]